MMGNDDLLYEYVIDELEETSLIKGLWAKAIAHSEGNNDKAKSLYIQYRVQSIKDEFNSFGINYTELEKDKLFSIIKSGFKITEETNQIKVEQEEKIEVLKKLNEEKTNNEKYGKIKGWLIFFAFLLVLWNLSQFGFVQYFTDEYISAIKNMYLAGNEKMAESYNYIFYSELFTSFMLFLFTLSFFSKDKNTRIVAIYFFVTLFIAKSFQVAQLINIFNEINKIPFMEISKITASLLWLFIFLLYFIFSKRVKKTFIKETKVESLILISVIIPIILFFYYANNLKVIKNDISLTKTENIIKETNNNQNQAQTEQPAEAGSFKADINDLILIISDSRGKEKLMKLSFSIESSEPTIATAVEAYKAEILDIVISQISSRSSEELLTVGGKNLLKDELVNEINGVLNNLSSANIDKKIAKDSVKTIIFTTLVIK
ncbi:flagellar basal body-associated FliL family protein [Aliarcobacter cibarius]|uniref:flagellar basal body-associated FliL family protein n=1 Tax=Aliarcobacter cibarius TaxID=255507 RepID=UPI001D183821|nr:flagellar basal body-associated FliL family protein [Aliarcobacter cibarius]